jgi:hypothetical protein
VLRILTAPKCLQKNVYCETVPVKMTFAAGPEYAKVAKEKDLYIEKTVHR